MRRSPFTFSAASTCRFGRDGRPASPRTRRLRVPTPERIRAALLLALLPVAVFAAEPVQLRWLGDAAPAAPNGITWGVPWPKAAVQKTDSFALTAADGKSLPVQSWPLAFWPDGSVK